MGVFLSMDRIKSLIADRNDITKALNDECVRFACSVVEDMKASSSRPVSIALSFDSNGTLVGFKASDAESNEVSIFGTTENHARFCENNSVYLNPIWKAGFITYINILDKSLDFIVAY